MVAVMVLGQSAHADELPKGLVYLRDIDITIIQDIRYATGANFTRKPVPGYEASECVLVREAAEALKLVQSDLRARGFSLKVYDCYRPVRAVKSFVGWTQSELESGEASHYPRVERSRLVAFGYIGAASTHSRGIAVDASIVALPRVQVPTFDEAARYGPCNGAQVQREPDDSVDMGTGFDCFDPMSATASGEIAKAQAARRRALVDAMAVHGFRNYDREWWHFTYQKLPVVPAPQDFVIGAHSAESSGRGR